MCDKQYYVKRADNTTDGPYDVVTLLRGYRAGKYPENTLIRSEKMDQWMTIDKVIVDVEKDLSFPITSSQACFLPCNSDLADMAFLMEGGKPSKGFLDAFFWLICTLSAFALLMFFVPLLFMLFDPYVYVERVWMSFVLVAVLVNFISKILFLRRLYETWKIFRTYTIPRYLHLVRL
jgi:hypothetical protein